MTDTIKNVPIPVNEWIDVYDSSGLPVSSSVDIHNVGSSDVYISVQKLQPPADHDSYIVIKPRGILKDFGLGASGLWVFSSSGGNGGKINVSPSVPESLDIEKTATGLISTAEDSRVVEMTASQGILDNVLIAELGGTATASDGKFIASTGTGTDNVAAIISSRQAKARDGQGLKGVVTTRFSAGVANNTQQCGLISSDSAFGFGYNGVDLGIVYSNDGKVELQELTITTSPSIDESVSVTVDGVVYSIPITASDINTNAFEIYQYLNINELRYQVTSNNNTVLLSSKLPDFGSGVFDFSSVNGASASWVEIQNSNLPAETWINKEDWNIRPDINIDPVNLNLYMIKFQSLVGSVDFYVLDPDTSKVTMVHTIKYASFHTLPIVEEPIFRIGWACRNTGNTTNITVEGSSASIFVEGKIELTQNPTGQSHEQLNIGLSRTNVLAIRNRSEFRNKNNRTEVYPVFLQLATDTTKTSVFEIVANPEVTLPETLLWEYQDKNNSTVEFSKTRSLITGGTVIGAFEVKASQPESIEIDRIFNPLSPSDSVSIASRVTQGAASTMNANVNWREDKG